jgi:hypothetical protein
MEPATQLIRVGDNVALADIYVPADTNNIVVEHVGQNSNIHLHIPEKSKAILLIKECGASSNIVKNNIVKNVIDKRPLHLIADNNASISLPPELLKREIIIQRVDNNGAVYFGVRKRTVVFIGIGTFIVGVLAGLVLYSTCSEHHRPIRLE